MTVAFDDSEPGNKKGYKYDWKEIAAQLKSHPGKWGIVSADGVKETTAAAMATARRIKIGNFQGGEPGAYDATVRRTTIWARYVKDQEYEDE